MHISVQIGKCVACVDTDSHAYPTPDYLDLAVTKCLDAALKGHATIRMLKAEMDDPETEAVEE